MRRCSVLLSVLLGAGLSLVAAPGAHASSEQLCAIVWTEGTVAPHASTGATCVSYPYGKWCEHHHAWVHPEAHVHAYFCYPAIT